MEMMAITTSSSTRVNRWRVVRICCLSSDIYIPPAEGEHDRAVFIERSRVAGVKPAIFEGLGGLLRVAVIAHQNVRALDADLAAFIDAQILAGLGIADGDLLAGHRAAEPRRA